MHRGFTKRWRKRWDNGYHKDLLMWVLMDYFIDFANHKETEIYIKSYGKVRLYRGQHLFGTKKLSDFFGVTRQKLRSSLQRLQDVEFLTIKTTNRFSVATITNYNSYQSTGSKSNQPSNQPATSQQPASNQPATTPKELKELKELEERKEITHHEIISKTITFLNNVTKSNFKSESYATQTLIIDRINEGFCLDDFISVIKKKTSQWIDDEKMSGNLRPATLFASDKFEGYLQEARRNGNAKPKAKPKLTDIQLMSLGYDIISNHGNDKFSEFCKLHNLSSNDCEAIRSRWEREQQPR